MTEELRKLRLEREQVKSASTRFITFIDKFSDNKIIQLESRLEDSKQIWLDFNRIQGEIEFSDETELDNCTERENFEDKFYEIIERANLLIKRVKSENNTGNVTNTSQQPILTISPVNNATNVRFPTLELPKFYGEYEKWGQFRDMFLALVHNDATMDKMEKFYYLISCIKGEFSKVIEAIEVTESNYENAWDLLKSRYENKLLTIKNHVRALVEAPAIVRDVRANLRKLTDDIQKHTRSLKTLGEPVDNWDTLLIYLISRKLDVASQKEWEEYLITENLISPKLANLTVFLEKRCQLLETLDNSSKLGNINKIEKPQKLHFRKYSNEKSLSHVSTKGTNNQGKFCAFCKEEHYIYHCEKLKSLSVASRLAEIKRLKLCTNCLRKGHTINECWAQSCKLCPKRHNTLLHINDISNEPCSETNENNIRSDAACNNNNTSISNHCSQRARYVLLSTAIISVKGKDGEWYDC
ncbi:uncharacterized protein [Leptinotarsa decemlineata]|uniref:uncharacterized protein n=1 Tax=Leptinotarsa decemlineata TaxID=7539 RepID=UPI003D308623